MAGIGFKNSLVADHLGMLSSDEFGDTCLNNRTGETFEIIKTDTFVDIQENGIPIIEEKPMFNTCNVMTNSLGNIITTDIKQFDTLIIDSINYIVREVKQDGIGGLDIYLKG